MIIILIGSIQHFSAFLVYYLNRVYRENDISSGWNFAKSTATDDHNSLYQQWAAATKKTTLTWLKEKYNQACHTLYGYTLPLWRPTILQAKWKLRMPGNGSQSLSRSPWKTINITCPSNALLIVWRQNIYSLVVCICFVLTTRASIYVEVFGFVSTCTQRESGKTNDTPLLFRVGDQVIQNWKQIRKFFCDFWRLPTR